LSCNYCGAVKDGAFKEPKYEMTIEMAQQLFSHKYLKRCLLVDLLGGEPLLCKDIVPIVKFLSSKGFLTNFSTNGLLLADKIEGLKEAGITRVNVSIYPGNFKVLSSSLPRINGVFQVHSSYVLTRTELETNQKRIFDVIDMVKSSCCKSLRFWMYRSRGSVPDYSEIITSDSVAYQEFLTKAREKYANFILFPQVVPSPLPENLNIETKKICAQLWQRAIFSADGTVGLCCGAVGTIPNISLFSNSLEEIYNCEKMVEIRKNLLDSSAPPLEMCKNCNLLTEKGW
jgi:MoaA/NifB/PqqE/SkfB family radical SAM enzyme